MAIAKPLFGTTLSHYSILWEEEQARRLVDWLLSEESELRMAASKIAADSAGAGG